MLMWRRCANGVPASYCLGLTTPNGSVKRALRNTEPVRRRARSVSARTSPSPTAKSGVPANERGLPDMERRSPWVYLFAARTGAESRRGAQPTWSSHHKEVAMTIHAIARPTVDFNMVKGRQQAAWSSGDYAIVGTTLQIVGETLCEAVDLRSNQRVLDVAAGNGNATLAAARRFAEVVSTDYVGTLLDRGRERAQAERLTVTFQQADAENLPFPDTSFDVVLSTFGVMFTPDHQRAASELLRVCRSGGKIGLANWTPESFIGRL